MPSYVREIPFIPVSKMDHPPQRNVTALWKQRTASLDVNRAEIQVRLANEIAKFF